MPRKEALCRRAGRGPLGGFREKTRESRRGLLGVPDREDRLACRLHRAADAGDRRTQDDGEPGQKRLEHVVPAPCPERPAEKGDVAEPVGRSELSDRIEEKDVGRAGPARRRTPCDAEPCRTGPASRLVPRLGAAGGEEEERGDSRAREGAGKGEDEIELFLGDRSGDQNRPARGQRADLCRERRLGRERAVELHVPGDVDPALGDAGHREARGVFGCPGRHRRQGFERAAEEAPRGANSPRRTFGEASAGDENRQGASTDRPEEDGPELGLDENEETRRGRIEEAPDREGQVEGEGLEPRGREEVPEPLSEEPDAGRRRGGDEERKLGAFGPEGQDERVGKLDFTDRDPLDPHVGLRQPTRWEEAAGDQRRKAGTSLRPGGFSQPAFLEEVTIPIREAAL